MLLMKEHKIYLKGFFFILNGEENTLKDKGNDLCSYNLKVMAFAFGCLENLNAYGSPIEKV